MLGLTTLMVTQWEHAGPVIEERTRGISKAWGEATASMAAFLHMGQEDDALREKFNLWRFLAEGLAGTFNLVLYPVQALIESIGALLDIALRAEELTWEKADRQMARVLRRQGLSGVQLRQFMAANEDLSVDDLSEAPRRPETARFRSLREQLMDLVGAPTTAALIENQKDIDAEALGGRTRRPSRNGTGSQAP